MTRRTRPVVAASRWSVKQRLMHRKNAISVKIRIRKKFSRDTDSAVDQNYPVSVSMLLKTGNFKFKIKQRDKEQRQVIKMRGHPLWRTLFGVKFLVSTDIACSRKCGLGRKEGEGRGDPSSLPKNEIESNKAGNLSKRIEQNLCETKPLPLNHCRLKIWTIQSRKHEFLHRANSNLAPLDSKQLAQPYGPTCAPTGTWRVGQPAMHTCPLGCLPRRLQASSQTGFKKKKTADNVCPLRRRLKTLYFKFNLGWLI